MEKLNEAIETLKSKLSLFSNDDKNFEIDALKKHLVKQYWDSIMHMKNFMQVTG